MPAPSSLSLVGKTKAKGKGKAKVSAVQELEDQLKAAPNDLNVRLSSFNKLTLIPVQPLSDLLDLLRSATSPAQIHAAVYALHRTFTTLIRQGRLHGKLRSTEDAALKQVRDWLKERYVDYIGQLVYLLHGQEGVRLSIHVEM